LGAVPFGLILYWFLEKKDIRSEGSGNIGAANVFRVRGSSAGILTLLLDLLKGALPVLYGLKHFEDPVMVISGGAAAILGHSFSIYLKFKGGKGIATFLGLFLVFHFPSACVFGAAFLVTIYFTRYVSAGSLAGITAVFFMMSFTHVVEVSIVVFAIVLMIVTKHRDNIKRMLTGTERKWSCRHTEKMQDE
jgi:glycerol-3-phosphate acyltransferase PlsY